MLDCLQTDYKAVPWGDQQALIERFMRKWWPDHTVLHINNYTDYENIGSWLDNQEMTTRKLISCFEEDWLTRTDPWQVRSVMKDHPNWTSSDFVLTASEKDFQITSGMGIGCLWRPGPLDMLVYDHYDSATIKFDLSEVQHHTGMLHSKYSPARQMIGRELLRKAEKLSALFLPRVLVNNTIYRDQDLITTQPAPWVDIEIDLRWSRTSAFVTTVETMYESEFGPYLSEKSYKAMHLLRPSMIYGCRGTRDYLRRLGFDTWDWFTDWSWDQLEHGPEKIFQYNTELSRLLNTPISSLVNLIEKNQHRLLANRERLGCLLQNYKDITFSE